MALTLQIETCHDCPRFEMAERRHWMAGHTPLWEYRCTKISRVITPADGVDPPPSWCPLRIPSESTEGER